MHARRFLALTLLTAFCFQVPLPVQGQARLEDFPIDATMRTKVIAAALKELKERYVFPDVAEKMEKAVHERMERKEYDEVTSSAKLCTMLTDHLREVCKDKHLRVLCGESGPRVLRRPSTGNDREEMRRFMAARNFGFEKLERLPGNIGYLDLRGFNPAAEAGETAAAAMGFLANTDALIIDLRKNGGGDPAMVALLCSYLFDQSTHLNDIYNRVGNTTKQFWTLPYVPGKKYIGKEVYILTSNYTFSGAEEFTYNLKNLKRATIIGETTGGGAHPVGMFPLAEKFRIVVPVARAINPITKTNWEGTGVTPDVPVPAAHALKTAQVMALKKQLEKTTNEEFKKGLQDALRDVEKELEELKGAKSAAK